MYFSPFERYLKAALILTYSFLAGVSRGSPRVLCILVVFVSIFTLLLNETLPRKPKDTDTDALGNSK